MLVRSYIEALPTDKALADQIWQLWNDDVLDDEQVNVCWGDIAARSHKVSQMLRKISKTLGTI